MNFKEWIFPLTFSVVMTFAFQYYLNQKMKPLPESQKVKSGQGFLAPSVEEINKPLLLSVEYEENKTQLAVSSHKISTPHASYVFSNKGAVLQDFSFSWNNKKDSINSLAMNENCFLLAFEKDTPLMYTMTNSAGNNDTDQIVEYKADFNGGTITKLFTVYRDSFQIDLDISLNYKNSKVDEPISMRLFLAQPTMNPGISWEQTEAFVNTQDNKALTIIDISKGDQLQNYWAAPNSFGYDSRFLIHSLVKDSNEFLQRAYIKKEMASDTTAVLESRSIKKSGQWKLSFFMGPKTVDAVEKVDSRLLQTLNYGWFSSLAKYMLYLLNYLSEKLGNYGWAIILLTLLIKILLMPFTMHGEQNMRKSMDVQKKLAYLQQKHKNDREALDRERAELIKKHGMPGLTGCLPLFLNIPMFIALNKVLSNAIEMYGASFLWISNLAEKDPYYILPVLTGIGMCFTPMGNDPKQNLSRFAFALVLASITTYLSAGLALFICVNTLLSILQTRLQQR